MVAGEFGIIESAINPMKGVTTEAAMQYRRRLGTRRVYMPTIRKRQRDTTVRRFVSDKSCCDNGPEGCRDD
jgi:hypothetical protein